MSRFKYAYLLLCWSGLRNIIPQYGHQFRHSVDASGISAIWGGAVYLLSLCLGLLKPFSGYGVYDVKNPQLVCPRSSFEVCVDFLDKDRLGL